MRDAPAPCLQVGYGKEVISRGKFAELLQDYRPFNDDERQFFDESAQFAYESFRDRAAQSRGMEPAEMQELAQGRVWSGHRALENKCARAAMRGCLGALYAGPANTAMSPLSRSSSCLQRPGGALKRGVTFARPRAG